jgi:hypothetical protein
MIDRAVHRIEAAGNPASYFNVVARDAERRRRRKAGADAQKLATTRAGSLTALSPDVQLALEMATQEETERAALEEDLSILETAWREAEEIAAIADNLLVPTAADQFIERHRPGRPAGLSSDHRRT